MRPVEAVGEQVGGPCGFQFSGYTCRRCGAWSARGEAETTQSQVSDELGKEKKMNFSGDEAKQG